MDDTPLLSKLQTHPRVSFAVFCFRLWSRHIMTMIVGNDNTQWFSAQYNDIRKRSVKLFSTGDFAGKLVCYLYVSFVFAFVFTVTTQQSSISWRLVCGLRKQKHSNITEQQQHY
jgi:hypothetical protein